MKTPKTEIIAALKTFADIVGGECTIVVERGTASISEENVRLLTELSGGKIRVARASMDGRRGVPSSVLNKPGSDK